MTVEEMKQRALARAAAVQRVLSTPDGKVLLEVMEDFAEELRAQVHGVDAGPAFMSVGAQKQIDNLKFYAKERSNG